MSDYKSFADALAAEIRYGRLQPGERLPPQRDFAFRQGIAASTASRVYAELMRRGLTVGEVGRGTYVRDTSRPSSMVLLEPSTAPVDLESNFPILEGQDVAIAAMVRKLSSSRSGAEALRPVGAHGSMRAREAAALYLSRKGFRPNPDRLLFTAGGRQAIAAALSAFANPGDRIGIEAFSYAVVKGIASRLGISLVPITLDDQGISPSSLMDAHRAAPLKAVYLQPSVHNPLGCTMSQERRQDIAEVLRVHEIPAIEDGINSFLADEPPLASFAPSQTIFLESLSKRAAPGLTLGFLVAPDHLVDTVAASIRSGCWAAAGFALAAGVAWMTDPAAGSWITAKRRDAQHRQRLAREILQGLDVRGDPRAYHLWLELPERWRSDAFASAALKRGIAVTPGSAFAVSPGHAPNAVRLALGSPPESLLKSALETLSELARSEPGWDVAD